MYQAFFFPFSSSADFRAIPEKRTPDRRSLMKGYLGGRANQPWITWLYKARIKKKPQ